MIPLVLVALLLACGGRQRDDDTRLQPGELDLDSPPPAASPSPSPSSSTQSPQPPLPVVHAPRYRGKPIDLDLKDADLHNVFRLLADVGGVNIAVADDVKGSVTLRLRQVPWDQVLATVVALKKLRLQRDGDLYLVTVR